MTDNIECYIIELLGPRQLVITKKILDINIAPDEVYAKTIYTAISPGTEIAAYKGDPPLRPCKAYPRVVGYCNVAEIVAKGEDVSEYDIGDKILTGQSHRSAFVCKTQEIMMKLPKQSDLRKSVTTYLFELGYDALLKGNIKPGYNIAVVGLGTLGMTTLAMAGLSNSKVYGFSNQRVCAEIAQKMGVTVFRKDDDSYISLINKDTAGIGIDLVVTTSNQWTDWEMALKLVRKGGTIIIMGFPGRSQPIPNFNPLDSQYLYDKQLTISTCGYTPDYDIAPCDIRFTIKRNIRYLHDLIQNDKLPVADIISGKAKWNKIEEVYQKYVEQKSNLFTYILDWN
jgi:threonine dehydrogenase-like Zn-dependent dehydrogenase